MQKLSVSNLLKTTPCLGLKHRLPKSVAVPQLSYKSCSQEQFPGNFSAYKSIELNKFGSKNNTELVEGRETNYKITEYKLFSLPSSFMRKGLGPAMLEGDKCNGEKESNAGG